MSRIHGATIDGINTFLSQQRELSGIADITIAAFRSTPEPKIEYLVEDRNIQLVAPITFEDYRPVGGTPLYWAQSTEIDKLGSKLAAIREEYRPARVVFVTVTDGLDTDERVHPNHSRLVVAEKIKHQIEKYNWDFSYIGANQDAEAVGSSMGIAIDKCLTYAANEVSTRAAFGAASVYTGVLRTANLTPEEAKHVGYCTSVKASVLQSGTKP